MTVTLYNGKRYFDCTRCDQEQWVHLEEENCATCQSALDAGLCWGCQLDDALPPEERFPQWGETISDERLNAIIAKGQRSVALP